MPQVPTYEPRVREQALPSVRVNTQAPDGAFGSPQTEAALAGASKLIDVGQKIFEEERKKADDAQTQGLFADLTKMTNDLRYNSKDGLITQTGEKAFSAVDSFRERYKKGVEELSQKAMTREQRLMFQKMESRVGADFDGDLQRHASVEGRKVQQDRATNLISTLVDDSVLNYQKPGKVDENLALVTATIEQYGANIGQPPEETQRLTANAVSKVHSGVINRMLANGQDREAKSYFDTIKASGKPWLTGSDVDNVEKALEEGSTRGESQRRSDAIFAGSKSMSDALEKARAIEEPKLRDATVQRVKERYSEQHAADEDRRRGLYLYATNLIDAKPGKQPRDTIPPGVWSQLSLEQRNALENRADNPVNDDKAWLDFLDLGAGQLAGLSRADFETSYWSKFDKAHRGRAETIWDASKKDQDKAGHLTAALTFKDRVDNALRSTGTIPADKERSKFSKTEAKLYADFEQAAARNLEIFEISNLGGKRKATGEEMQKIVDDILMKKVFVDRGWGTMDKQLPAQLVSPADRGKSYVPYADVPAAERTAIENQLRAAGKRIDKRRIERAYGAVLMGDSARLKAILAE